MDSLHIKDKKITNLFGEALLDLEHYIPKTAMISSSNIVITPEFKFNIWNKDVEINLTDYPMHIEGIVKLCKLYGINYNGHIPFKPLAEFIQFNLDRYETLFVTYTESEILSIHNKPWRFQNPLNLYSAAPVNESDVVFVDYGIEMSAMGVVMESLLLDRYKLCYVVYNSVLGYTSTKIVYGLYDTDTRGFIAMPYLGVIPCSSITDESMRLAALYDNIDTRYDAALFDRLALMDMNYKFNALELVNYTSKIKKLCSNFSVENTYKMDADSYCVCENNVKSYKQAVKLSKLWGDEVDIPQTISTEVKVFDVINELLLNTGFNIDKDNSIYPVLDSYKLALLAGELLTLCIRHIEEN